MSLQLSSKWFKVAACAALLSSSAPVMASEFNYGQGSMTLEGGFLGLQDSIKDDVTVYSLKAQHSNLFGSKAFYSYRLSWYDSKEVVNGQQTFNSTSSQASGWFPSTQTPFTLPSIDYRLQGLDANLSLGYDVIHQGERDFLGLGVLMGLSTPWINSSQNSSNSSSSNTVSVPDSKTEFWTYKIGPTLVMRKSLGHYFSVYGSLAYAYQTAHIKNMQLNVSADVNGDFTSYDFGLRFQPVSVDFQLGWLTLSPRFYATAGLRNSQWTVKDLAIDVSNQNLPLPKSDLKFKADTYYLGFGFDF